MAGSLALRLSGRLVGGPVPVDAVAGLRDFRPIVGDGVVAAGCRAGGG